MKYDLSHLTQESDQRIAGPIQDDEALLLFSLCRTMLIKNIVEIGTGTDGYSAINFIKSVGEDGNVITIDINPFKSTYSNLTFIQKNVSKVEPIEIPWEIDLVFFDSHDEEAQTSFYKKMLVANKITNNTIIAVHDTNLHPDGLSIGIKTNKGWIHQPEEWKFVNKLINDGWCPFHFHTKLERHNNKLPFRHGLTILNKKIYLNI